MKKLLFLVPVAAWIACYFLWTAHTFGQADVPTSQDVWWFLTDFFSLVGSVALLVVAIDENL